MLRSSRVRRAGCAVVAELCPILCDPMDSSPPGSSVHGILQATILKWVAMPSSRGSSQPRDRTQVSHIAGGFFIGWATREVHGVGSLSLLQVIFLTQESNQGLLHCRQIIYQRNYQGRPVAHQWITNILSKILDKHNFSWELSQWQQRDFCWH